MLNADVRLSMENAGIYVHVPFCLKKCDYCDFYSIMDLSAVDDFVHAVADETAMTERPDFVFDTLYFGGGTPSLLSPSHICTLIDTIKNVLHLIPGSEITLEANPKTVSLKGFAEYRAAGVNRLHIGVQSFDDRHLQFLGRVHSSADAVKTVKQARSIGFDNLGIDLIYGLPRQTKSSWTEDLKQAVGFRPEHLSCYMLTLEPGTPLYRDCKGKKFTPLSEAGVRELYETTVEFLEDNGYDQYEVSNFARRDESDRDAGNRDTGDEGTTVSHNSWKSRHNGKYWSGAPYLGFGPSAHSFIPPVRYWNVRSLESYLESIKRGYFPLAEKETLTREQQMIEAVYLGLRTTSGIDIVKFGEKFETDFQQTFDAALVLLVDEGLVQLLPDRCRLTRRGMIFLDSVVDRLVCVI